MMEEINYIKTGTTATSNLTRLYVAALTAVALLAILGQILIQRSITDQLSDSRIVNLAGKQRFKSQEIGKLVLLIENGYDHPDYPEKLKALETILTTWEKEHHGLQYGDQELDLPGNNSDKVMEMFDDVDPLFLAILRNAKIVINHAKQDSLNADSVNLAVKEIMKNEKVFLTKMDAIVHQFDIEAKSKVIFLRKVEVVLMVLTLMILNLEAYFVFRPAVRKIKDVITDLIAAEKRSTTLASDLSLANVELKQSHERERKTRTIALIEGQENERKSISMEIHDGLGQLLNAIKYNLQNVNIGAETELEKLDVLKTIASEAIQEARRISYNLMPSVLTDMGLSSALKHLADYSCKFSGVTVLYETNGEYKRIEQSSEVHLYRIAQEAVNNSIKYSKANTISLKLQVTNKQLMLIVKDDGVGFDVDDKLLNTKASISSGNGLSNLKERANIIDAHLSITSIAGKGTTVQIEMERSQR